MCKIILNIGLLLLSLNASAQVTSPLLNCVDRSRNNFQFTAIFNGKSATVVFKGWTYQLKYTGAWVSSRGERWSQYENQDIFVGTTFPFDKYVDIQTGAPSSRPIAGAFCD